MKEIDEVIAETWQTMGTDQGVYRSDGDKAGEFQDDAFATGKTRSAVAALGKRALALVLKYEWYLGDYDIMYVCVECHRVKPIGHAPDCEVGAICDEVRRLRETPE